MTDIPCSILVNGINVSLDKTEGDVLFLSQKYLKHIGLHGDNLVYCIYKRSIDARKKEDIRLIFTILVHGYFSKRTLEQIQAGKYENVSLEKKGNPNIQVGDTPMDGKPLIVGSGPAGLFCAYLLAKAGFEPILIERGGSISERKQRVDLFHQKQILDTEANIQFGAGGAGTFSDGKLITRVNDPITKFVLETFVSFGAPKEILTLAKPHIGTDILASVVENMISKIEELGGSVYFHTKMLSFEEKSGNVYLVHTTQGDFSCGALILAIGHSARDTYEYVLEKGMAVESKNFSCGMRVEHLQSAIDESLYGKFAGHPALGPATYSLSFDTKNRGVYSFCMCPGGVVVAATSEENQVAVNGMSYHARDGKNANSAINVSIFKEDFDSDPRKGIALQRKIESQAYFAAGANYSAPIVTMGDFLNGKAINEPTIVKPTYMNGEHYKVVHPKEYLPDFVVSQMQKAMPSFNRSIAGFSCDEAVLTGPETRTSSPLRILRNSETKVALGYQNLYPAGEGAGYAGGITSAALDGIHIAEAIMTKYHK